MRPITVDVTNEDIGPIVMGVIFFVNKEFRIESHSSHHITPRPCLKYFLKLLIFVDFNGVFYQKGWAIHSQQLNITRGQHK
jgi:hypothetical protein